MPNVNYRGKLPSQDPNAPPESGMTSIPLGAPWPPLSREQVVKLHEALVAFRREMEASKGIRSHEDQQDMIWGAAVELDGLLVEMGIGSPPPTRTWTHEEVAKVAEEVQTVTFEEALKSGTAHAVYAQQQDRFGHITDLSRHSKPREEPTTDEDSGPGAMSWQQAEEFGLPFATEPPVAPPKRNCWTCDHDKVFGGGTAHICTALPPRRSKGTGDSPTVKAISAWTDSQTLDASLMPPKDSDGCPGWEPKNETAKRECWTCGSFHINNGCGKKWTASAVLVAHLKKMDDMIDGGASTTEVASMDLNCPGWERNP